MSARLAAGLFSLRFGDVEKAERIIGEELRRLGWLEAQLALRRKRDPSKLEIAVRLRRETTTFESEEGFFPP